MKSLSKRSFARAVNAIVLSLAIQSVHTTAATADFEVSAGIEHDSNLNVVELDKKSDKGDTAALLNAKLDASWKPKEKLNLSAGYAYASKTYQDNKEFNLAIHQLYADVNYEFSLLTAGASHHFANAQLDGDAFLDLHQTSLYIAKLINNKIYLRGAINAQDKKFDSLSERNATNNGFAGDAFLFFNEGKTFINVGAVREKENARAHQFDYKGVSYKAKVSHKFTTFEKDNKLQLGWRYNTKDYSGVTPEIKAQRYDSAHVADVSWEVSFTPKISLETKLERGKYNSNLATADYSENRVSITLKARF